MFTEHPSEKSDYFKDGHRGMKDGVLMIPGAETGGFLVFPSFGRAGGVNPPGFGPVYRDGSPQEFADLVRGREGLIFLSHLEELMAWGIRPLPRTELYTFHAHFKDEKTLHNAVR